MIRKIFFFCPKRHCGIAIGLSLILFHVIVRNYYPAAHYISLNVVRPINHFCTTFSSLFGFSLAELFIAALSIGFIIYLIYIIFRKGFSFEFVYKLFASAVMLVVLVYTGFCMLWGWYFYDDDFAAKSGLDNDPISVTELETVTAFFADLANHYSSLVERNEQGVYTVDRRSIIDKSPEVYNSLEARYDCLQGPDVKVKGIHFSRLLSYFDFTGFYFPLTGEANVNIDFPPSLFASTVAHEISHQRGVCKEQEANFLAVLSSLEYGDVDYCYSACLLAYTHLGNALYDANYEAWEKIYRTLDQNILIDFAYNRTYWAQFETPVQQVSNAVYENFMYSYNQDLGLKSYGACVDLLVNYYYEKAADYLR